MMLATTTCKISSTVAAFDLVRFEVRSAYNRERTWHPSLEWTTPQHAECIQLMSPDRVLLSCSHGDDRPATLRIPSLPTSALCNQNGMHTVVFYTLQGFPSCCKCCSCPVNSTVHMNPKPRLGPDSMNCDPFATSPNW